jgi:hypothetical protein
LRISFGEEKCTNSSTNLVAMVLGSQEEIVEEVGLFTSAIGPSTQLNMPLFLMQCEENR